MGVQPYFQTLKFPSGSTNPVFTGTPTTSNMPAPQTRQWYAWCAAFIDWWLAQNPIARTTRYYVSTSGSDAADGLTPATAWQTLAKANTVIASGGGDIRISLRRGDVFRVTVTGSSPNQYLRGLYSAVSHVTFDSYTDETVTGTTRNRKPIITPFITIAAGSWTLDGVLTNTYKCTITALTGAVNAVAWVREQLDVNDDRVFVRRTSAANVDANPGSFYYDPAANLLWMRPHLNGMVPTSGTYSGYEYCPQFRIADFRSATLPNLTGADVSAGIYWGNVDDIRVDGIRVDGWLMSWNDIASAVNFAGIQGDFNGTNRATITDCEVYYSAQHCIIKGDNTGGTGGHLMCVGCRTGMQMAYEAAIPRQVQDHLMSYCAGGGNSGVFVDCEGTVARLPSETFNDFALQGEYIRSHATAAMALQLAYRCKIKPCRWMPKSFGTFGTGVNWTTGGDMSACRALRVQCEFPARHVDALDSTWWSGTGTLVYNNAWAGAEEIFMGCKITTKAVRTDSASTPAAYSGASLNSLVNCQWDIDMSQCRVDTFSVIPSSAYAAIKGRWYFNRIRILHDAHQGGSVSQIALGAAGLAGLDTWARSSQAVYDKGNVYEIVGMCASNTTVVSGLGNNLDSGGSILPAGSERSHSNAYVGGWTDKGLTTNFYGAVNVPQVVFTNNASLRPNSDSPLVITAMPTIEGVTLEHDMEGTKRVTPTIGPITALSYTGRYAVAGKP